MSLVGPLRVYLSQMDEREDVWRRIGCLKCEEETILKRITVLERTRAYEVEVVSVDLLVMLGGEVGVTFLDHMHSGLVPVFIRPSQEDTLQLRISHHQDTWTGTTIQRSSRKRWNVSCELIQYGIASSDNSAIRYIDTFHSASLSLSSSPSSSSSSEEDDEESDKSAIAAARAFQS